MEVELLGLPREPASQPQDDRDWMRDLRLALLIEAMSAGDAVIADACAHAQKGLKPATQAALLFFGDGCQQGIGIGAVIVHGSVPHRAHGACTLCLL